MLNRKLNVAPMMGYTDKHYRYLLRLMSPHAVLYSEMIVANALIHGNRERFLDHSKDGPCAVQLGGNDPEMLAKCAVLVQGADYQEVNLNLGCPSNSVQQSGIGACLMATPGLVADCYQAMQESVSIPVTIKSRTGIDARNDFGFFEEFITSLYDAGCRVFLIHARNAILHGLSPRENRDIPPLRYDHVARIRDTLPDAEFILNGGIRTVAQTMTLLNEYEGVMLGRAPCHNPFLLATLEQCIFQTALPSRWQILAHYRSYMAQQTAQGVPFRQVARHLSGLFAGLPGARAYRRHLGICMNSDGASTELLDSALAQIQLVRYMIDELLQLFQGLVTQEDDEAPDQSVTLVAAALMLEVSRSDSTKTRIELDTIARLMAEEFGLSAQKVSSLIRVADAQVEAAHDLYQFTQVINQQLDYAGKKRLLYAMWLVAFADKRVDAIEDHTIRKIARLLHLAHEDFIREKLRARDDAAQRSRL